MGSSWYLGLEAVGSRLRPSKVPGVRENLQAAVRFQFQVHFRIPEAAAKPSRVMNRATLAPKPTRPNWCRFYTSSSQGIWLIPDYRQENCGELLDLSMLKCAPALPDSIKSALPLARLRHLSKIWEGLPSTRISCYHHSTWRMSRHK